jgi:hypothetical protein
MHSRVGRRPLRSGVGRFDSMRVGTWGANISRDKQPTRLNFFVWLRLLVSLLVFAVLLRVVHK